MNALHFWLVVKEFVQKQNLYDVLTLKHLKHQLVRIIILRHVIDKMPGFDQNSPWQQQWTSSRQTETDFPQLWSVITAWSWSRLMPPVWV